MAEARPTPTGASVAVLGAPDLVRGFALAGVIVLPADEPDAVRDAWRSLPDHVGLVLLTPNAALALVDDLQPARTWPLVAVMS